MARNAASALSGVLRDNHNIKDPTTGLYVRSALIEPAGVNLVGESENFSLWTLSNTPVRTPGQTDPFGGTAAYLLEDDSASLLERIYTPIVYTGDGVKSAALYVKQGTSVRVQFGIYDSTASIWRHQVRATWTGGVPTLASISGSGTLFPVEELANGWYRVLISVPGVVAANTNQFWIDTCGTIADVGSDYIFGAQTENSPVPTSYIPRTGGVGSRNADSLTYLYTAKPQALSMYCKAICVGASNQADSNWSVTTAMSIGFVSTPGTHNFHLRLEAGQSTRRLQVAHNIVSGNQVLSTVAAGPATTYGDCVEFLGVLYADGSCRGWSAVNGAAVNAGPLTTALELPAAWGAQEIRLGALSPTTLSGWAIIAAKVVHGVKTLDQMRAI